MPLNIDLVLQKISESGSYLELGQGTGLALIDSQIDLIGEQALTADSFSLDAIQSIIHELEQSFLCRTSLKLEPQENSIKEQIAQLLQVWFYLNSTFVPVPNIKLTLNKLITLPLLRQYPHIIAPLQQFYEKIQAPMHQLLLADMQSNIQIIIAQFIRQEMINLSNSIIYAYPNTVVDQELRYTHDLLISFARLRLVHDLHEQIYRFNNPMMNTVADQWYQAQIVSFARNIVGYYIAASRSNLQPYSVNTVVALTYGKVAEVLRLSMNIRSKTPWPETLTVAQYTDIIQRGEGVRDTIFFRGFSGSPNKRDFSLLFWSAGDIFNLGFRTTGGSDNYMITETFVSQNGNAIAVTTDPCAAAFFPMQFSANETWIYCVYPEHALSLMEHAQKSTGMFQRNPTSNEAENWWAHEFITRDIPPERVLAAIRIKRKVTEPHPASYLEFQEMRKQGKNAAYHGHFKIEELLENPRAKQQFPDIMAEVSKQIRILMAEAEHRVFDIPNPFNYESVHRAQQLGASFSRINRLFEASLYDVIRETLEPNPSIIVADIPVIATTYLRNLSRMLVEQLLSLKDFIHVDPDHLPDKKMVELHSSSGEQIYVDVQLEKKLMNAVLQASALKEVTQRLRRAYQSSSVNLEDAINHSLAPYLRAAMVGFFEQSENHLLMQTGTSHFV
ncbi:MAG: hypothetical protein ACHP9Y_02430 [Gammaproteobacteria bacterium]